MTEKHPYILAAEALEALGDKPRNKKYRHAYYLAASQYRDFAAANLWDEHGNPCVPSNWGSPTPCAPAGWVAP